MSHFSTTADKYSVIFTAGGTAALKLVAECFDYASKDGELVYLMDNHTSVLGMREYAPKSRAIHPQDFTKMHCNQPIHHKSTTKKSNSLFVFPAQSNFSGTKYPLIWIDDIRRGILDQFGESNWFVLLDATNFVSTNELDLSKHTPDFVAISFYKIFGYPTGLGALLVKNSSGFSLKKKYFGGGTVLMALSQENVVHRRTILHEKYVNFTPFTSIKNMCNFVALKTALYHSCL